MDTWRFPYSDGGTPSHHPFCSGIFTLTKTIQRAWGTPIYGHPHIQVFRWFFLWRQEKERGEQAPGRLPGVRDQGKLQLVNMPAAAKNLQLWVLVPRSLFVFFRHHSEKSVHFELRPWFLKGWRVAARKSLKQETNSAPEACGRALRLSLSAEGNAQAEKDLKKLGELCFKEFTRIDVQ